MYSKYVSPLQKKGVIQYLTFEPDAGGWNNIRMAMETVLAMAAATGRTLVLPPETEMYLLKTSKGKHGKQRDTFSFNHFFHMDEIHREHVGLNIITMQDFLIKEAMTGNMVSTSTGKVSFPPQNRTLWDGLPEMDQLFQWLRQVSYVDIWNPEECLAVFPASRDPREIIDLRAMATTIQKSPPKFGDYIGKPVPVNATPIERIKENWADRSKLCLYDEKMQEATFVHFPVDNKLKARLLVHFYAFLFFQNWKQDLWMKRYVRLNQWMDALRWFGSKPESLAHVILFLVGWHTLILLRGHFFQSALFATMFGTRMRSSVPRREWCRRFVNTLANAAITVSLMPFTFDGVTFNTRPLV